MRTLPILVLSAVLLAACSPEYNWRQYDSPDAPYGVLFPDKPASYTRTVNLAGNSVAMTMTAAEVNKTVFAVGTGEAPDAAAAQAALSSMKAALVRNIGAEVSDEKKQAGSALDIEARGLRNGQPMRLVGHFEARGTRFYQVIVLGPDGSVPDEQVDQFMTSFKLR
ncbi:hypothetical protein [Pseudoduganella sp. GCM10020061]|uniref:hypothetical protein n=1 Tax=Pseudoduganella sp. GCM10020061 TaxID=3317345 RepID=UPI0036370D4E